MTIHVRDDIEPISDPIKTDATNSTPRLACMCRRSLCVSARPNTDVKAPMAANKESPVCPSTDNASSGTPIETPARIAARWAPSCGAIMISSRNHDLGAAESLTLPL
jgi:hypothetical protein